MIRIVVDSTCDMPQALIDRYGIEVLPLHVLVGDKEYLDGVTITTKEVYALMRQDILPKTSQVSAADTHDRLEAFVRQGEDVLCLAFSARMSGTYALIRQIMEELKERYPERSLCTLDSKGGSFATGLIAIEAAKAAASGTPFDGVVGRCRFLIEHVEHVFVISDLTWMIRGGRISKTLGYTANLLGIKPVLDVDDGEMEVIQKVRGRKRSMERVADIVAERAARHQTIGITHADDIEAARAMEAMLRRRLPDCEFMIEEIGAVLGVHLGIGGVGVFFFNRL